MLKIFRQQMAVQLNETQCRDLGVKLSSRYAPLIAGIKREYWNKAGLAASPEDAWTLSAGNDSPLCGGDLYLVDPDTVLYFKFPREKSLEAGIITRKDPASYQDFFNSLRTLISGLTHGGKAEWEPLGRAPGRADGESETLHPTAQEVEAASELENDATRGLLHDILQKNSVFFNKLCEGRERTATERQVNRFDALQMISRDYAVLCSKTGQQILRVASRAAIEDPSHKNFKCYICGKAISDETVDEIITASDFGRKILSDDHWLLVRVVEAIRRMGLSENDLRLHRDDGLVNLSASINQESYLFVLATHKLSLSDAYLISAHVATDALDHVILVSNAHISSLMRNHLERVNPQTTFDVVDSLHGIEDRFEAILKEQEKKSLKRCLEAFASITPIRVQDLIMQRVVPDAQYLPEQLAETRAAVREEPVPAPEPDLSTGNGTRLAPPPRRVELARSEPVRSEPAPPMEEEPFYIEEVMPGEGSEETV